MHRTFALFLLALCCTLAAFLSPASAADQPVTITLPATAIHQTILSMLPLPLEQNGKKFQGTITVDSVRKLEIHDNRIFLEGQVSGRDMQITTNIGGQDLKLKLGKLVLPVTCNISLRFDPKKQTLFLRPKFENPSHGSSNSAKTLLPLLNSLGNREYPVKLDNLSPLNAKIGSRKISVRMQPTDIKAGNNMLVLKLRPITGKSH
jgi:hypothetical protein